MATARSIASLTLGFGLVNITEAQKRVGVKRVPKVVAPPTPSVPRGRVRK